MSGFAARRASASSLVKLRNEERYLMRVGRWLREDAEMCCMVLYVSQSRDVIPLRVGMDTIVREWRR